MMMIMMMMIVMTLQSVYLNDQRSVVMELDKNCNKNTPSLTAGLSGLLFTKLGNAAQQLHYRRTISTEYSD